MNDPNYRISITKPTNQKPMEISKDQQIKRVCNTVILITPWNRTWDDVAINARRIIYGMEFEISTRDVLKNWPTTFYPIAGTFDESKHQDIDKTGIIGDSKLSNED
jgi:hypothetical protein